MADGVRVLIAEDDQNTRNQLIRLMRGDPALRIAGVAADGREALSALYALEPDLLILDIIMPHIDGIGVLERLQIGSVPKYPSVIAISSAACPSVARSIERIDRDCRVVMPFAERAFMECLSDFLGAPARCKCDAPVVDAQPQAIEAAEGNTPSQMLSGLLCELGMSAKLKGYQYVREAIMLCTERIDMLDAVTKQLYPHIARRYMTTPMCVERCIRHAIEVAFNRASPDRLYALFGYTVAAGRDKPSNSAFIAMLADRMRMSGTA